MAWIDSLQWGNVPAGIGSVLTALSVAFAARQYGLSVQDRRREQIVKFSCWIEDTDAGPVLHVRNASEVALHRVVITVTGWRHNDAREPRYHKTETYEFQPLPPEAERTERLPEWAGWADPPVWQVMDAHQRFWRPGRRMGQPPELLHHNSRIRRILGLRDRTLEGDPQPEEDRLCNEPWPVRLAARLRR